MYPKYKLKFKLNSTVTYELCYIIGIMLVFLINCTLMVVKSLPVTVVESIYNQLPFTS